MALYSEIRKTQLKQNYNQDFIVSQILRSASNNQYWQNKQALWTIISGACTDAGKQFYVSLKKYIQNIADIDMCNIHAIKSISKQFGCQYLTDFISQDYPIELLNLLNLFSINKSNLLEQFRTLFYMTTVPRGYLDNRNQFIIPRTIYLDTLVHIKKNIVNLRKLFQYCKINLNKQIKYYIYDAELNFSGNNLQCLYKLNNNLVHINCNDITINDAISIITQFNTYVSLLNTYQNINNTKNFVPNNNKQQFTQIDILNKCMSSQYSFKIQYKNVQTKQIIEQEFFNPFFAIIDLIKNNYLLNIQRQTSLTTIFFDYETETVVDLTQLILTIFQSIQYYDQSYIQNFIFFHIYGLIYDKLINNQLLQCFAWNQYKPLYINKLSQYTENQFQQVVNRYISISQLETYKKQNYFFKKSDVDFIQYLSMLNSVLFNNKEQKKFQFKPYLFNNYFSISDNYNSQYRRLLNLDINGNLLGDNYIARLAKQFTDLCLQISYARQNIKTIIQQYTFIRNKQNHYRFYKGLFFKKFYITLELAFYI